MKVLVTGCAGFIGSHVAEALLEDGHEVVGLDAFIPYYPRAVKEANLATALAHPRFSFWETDLRTGDLAPLLRGVDAVVNEAAMAGLPLSWTDLEVYASCNLLGLGRLLDACVGAGVRRLLQVSTSSVYGTHAVGGEGLPTRPSSPYGVTKLAAEHLCQLYQVNHGVPTVSLRYFTVYGPRQRPDMAFCRFLKAAIAGTPVTLYGDGEQTRDFTYVDDAIAATLAAADQGVPGNVYNIGGGARVSVNHVLELVGRTTGRPVTIRREPPQKGDMRDTYADTSRARADLAFAPAVPLEEGLWREYHWLSTCSDLT